MNGTARTSAKTVGASTASKTCTAEKEVRMIEQNRKNTEGEDY